MAAGEVISLVKSEMAKVIVGQNDVIDTLLIGLLTGGHVLLQGMPGLAKTLAVKTLAQVMDASFSRIQFTPDLLPSDILGSTSYLPEEKRFETQLGPIGANLVLADEINRAPAKVQSALLEAMQEHQVTIGHETFQLPKPFMVVATMNPIEHSGTYRLPEAQKDRFMMECVLDYPQRDEEGELLERFAAAEQPSAQRVVELGALLDARKEVEAVFMDVSLKEYILDLVIATRPGERAKLSERQKKFDLDIGEALDAGASPRASIAMAQAARAQALLSGRDYVLPDDVKHVARLVLPHRLQLTFEAEAAGRSARDVVDELLRRLLQP